MKLSSFIEQLQLLLNSHGDIEVMVATAQQGETEERREIATIHVVDDCGVHYAVEIK